MSNRNLDDGTAIRRAVLGDEYVDRQQTWDDPFNEPLQRWFVESIWADVWGRDSLPRATRSLVVIAFLIAQGRADELKLHLRGAIRNGCTLEQIREVLLQGAAYCGGPAAMTATRAANEVLADEIAELRTVGRTSST